MTDDTVREDVVRDLFLSYARAPDPSHPNPKSAFLARDDLRALLASVGEHPPDARLRAAFDAVDADGSGTLDFAEFLDGYRSVLGGDLGEAGLRETMLDVDELVRVFRVLDRNGDGSVSRTELWGVLVASGGSIGAKEARKILKLADVDGSKSITLPEFLAFMTDDSDEADVHWRLRSGFRAVFVIGGPRSGKSMLCHRLEREAAMVRCDAEGLLEEEVARGSPLGGDIAKALDRGWPVKSSTVMALVRKKLSQCPGSFATLDGFPGSKRNCRDFEKVFGAPEFAVYIAASEEAMIERLLEEGTTGKESEADVEKAESRVRAFHALAVPMLKHLNNSGVVVHILDGKNSFDDMWAELLSLNVLLDKRVKKSTK